MSASRTGFKRIESLSPDELENLVQAASEVTMYPKRFMRMGINGMEKPSVYETCSFFKLPIRDAKRLKALLPQKYAEVSVLRYFLKFPANTGFLDGQSCWVGVPRPVDIVAWSLTDNNQIRVSTPLPDDAPLKEKLRVGNVVIADGKTLITDRTSIVTLAGAKITNAQTSPMTHTFNKGEGFLMSLNHYHEILKRGEDHLWVCMGVMVDVE